MEEQLATYIEEHYEGVTKIEFSPIFEDGGDGYSMHTLRVAVALYDKNGHRAVMRRAMNETFGTSQGLWLDFDGDGREVIELEDYDRDRVVDVSKEHHLPVQAQLETYRYFDEVVDYLVETKKLEGIKKSIEGSPDAKVTYNTEIKRGDYTKWH